MIGQIASVNGMKVNQNIGTDVIITAGEINANMKDARQQRTRLPGGTRGQLGHCQTREWADQEQELLEEEAEGLVGEPQEDQKMVLETEMKQGYKAAVKVQEQDGGEALWG